MVKFIESELYSEDAEMAVVGACLYNPQALGLIQFLKPDHFYLVKHRWIFAAMLKLYESKQAVDLLTVSTVLKGQPEGSTNQYQVIGGAYLTQIVNVTPSSYNVETYARIVLTAYHRRKLVEMADALRRAAQDTTISLDKVLHIPDEILNAIAIASTPEKILPIKDVVSSVWDNYETRVEKGINTIGIPTGLTRLDSLLGGLRKSRLHLVAARPGMGKSALLADFAVRIAKTTNPETGQPYRVYYASLEMNEDEIVERMIAANAQIPLDRVMSTDPNVLERGKIVKSMGVLSTLPIILDTTPELTPKILKAHIKKAKRIYGRIDIVFLDYVQLMQPDKKSQSREADVASISRALKQLSRSEGVPVVAAAQLNREVENRKSKKPNLSDLRESGALEQDADVVMFPNFLPYWEDPDATEGVLELIIAKHRNGAKGIVDLYVNFPLMRFGELERKVYAPLNNRPVTGKGLSQHSDSRSNGWDKVDEIVDGSNDNPTT